MKVDQILKVLDKDPFAIKLIEQEINDIEEEIQAIYATYYQQLKKKLWPIVKATPRPSMNEANVFIKEWVKTPFLGTVYDKRIHLLTHLGSLYASILSLSDYLSEVDNQKDMDEYFANIQLLKYISFQLFETMDLINKTNDPYDKELKRITRYYNEINPNKN